MFCSLPFMKFLIYLLDWRNLFTNQSSVLVSFTSTCRLLYNACSIEGIQTSYHGIVNIPVAIICMDLVGSAEQEIQMSAKNVFTMVLINLSLIMFIIVRKTSSCQTKLELWVKSQGIPPTWAHNYSPWCTSSGSILQLCKVSSISVHQFRRREIWLGRQTDWQDDPFVPQKNFVYSGYNKQFLRLQTISQPSLFPHL